MENKFTDNEIIKALECCTKVDACHECPYGAACLDDKYVSIIAKDALDLINRQKAEIERLNVELVGMRGACESYKMHYDNAKAEIERLQKVNDSLGEAGGKLVVAYKKAKSEARKEFAERLKKVGTKVEGRKGFEGVYVMCSNLVIDNLVKEMEGESVCPASAAEGGV